METMGHLTRTNTRTLRNTFSETRVPDIPEGFFNVLLHVKKIVEFRDNLVIVPGF